MTLRKISKDQPEKFEFNSESLVEANNIIKKYPKGKQQRCRHVIIVHCSKTER